MKKTLVHLIPKISILSLLFLFGCQFELTDVYESEISETITPANIEIIELNLNKDTTFVYLKKKVKFQFNAGDLHIYKVQWFVNGNLVFETGSNEGDFFIFEKPGVYIVTFKVLTQSGSKSIAANQGYEKREYTQSRTLVFVDNRQFQMNIEEVDGCLKLTWDSVKIEGFNYFRLFKNENFIESTKENNYIDSIYIGEYVHYRIDLQIHELASGWGTLTNERIELNISETVKADSFLVEWNENPFSKNIDSIYIYNHDTVFYAVKYTDNHITFPKSADNYFDGEIEFVPKYQKNKYRDLSNYQRLFFGLSF
jgi:hypothetical protein